MDFVLVLTVIGLTLALISIWRQKRYAEERAFNLMGDLEMSRVEIERLKIDLEKSKARVNDLSEKLVKLVRVVKTQKKNPAP